jgi:hypothetical protein
MGKLKDIVKFEKENMPSYQYNFLYKRLLPGFFYVIGGALFSIILAIILFFTTESDIIPIIPVIVWGVSVIPLLILFVIHSRKNSNRLLVDKTNEFENKYEIIEYKKAIEKLENNMLIKANMLHFDNGSVALEDCLVYFYAKTLSGAYSFSLLFYKKEEPVNDAFLSLDLDKNLMTYFIKNINLVYNQEAFLLFANEKKEFMKLLFKYNDPKKIDDYLKKNG